MYRVLEVCFQSLVSHCNWPSAKCQNPSSPQFNNNRPRSSSANIVDRSVRPVSIHCGIACCFRVWRQRQKVSISLYQSALTQDKSTETTTAQHRQALYVYILYFFIWKRGDIREAALKLYEVFVLSAFGPLLHALFYVLWSLLWFVLVLCTRKTYKHRVCQKRRVNFDRFSTVAHECCFIYLTNFRRKAIPLNRTRLNNFAKFDFFSS